MIRKSQASNMIDFFYYDYPELIGYPFILIPVKENIKDLKYNDGTYVNYTSPERLIVLDFYVENLSPAANGIVIFYIVFYEFSLGSYKRYRLDSVYLHVGESKTLKSEKRFFFEPSKKYSAEPDRFWRFEIDIMVEEIKLIGSISIERI